MTGKNLDRPADHWHLRLAPSSGGWRKRDETHVAPTRAAALSVVEAGQLYTLWPCNNLPCPEVKP